MIFFTGLVRNDSEETPTSPLSLLIESLYPPNSSSNSLNQSSKTQLESKPAFSHDIKNDRTNITTKENTFKEFYIKAETERSNADSKAANPSVDELIGSIIQLMSGGHKLSKPLNKPQLPQHLPVDQDVFNNNNMRINNRGPAFSQNNGHVGNMFPPNVLIGPGPPAGLPLPLNPYHNYHNKPMYLPPNKPPPNTILPPRSTLNIPENNITGLLGYKLHPHLKDTHMSTPLNPLRRIPGNNILPKPLHPLRDRDTGIGSQPQPDFAAPLPSFQQPHHPPRRPLVPSTRLYPSSHHHQLESQGMQHPSRSPSLVMEDDYFQMHLLLV